MAVGLEKWTRWERTRQGGRTRYIWLWGVCGWGIVCGVLMSAFNAAVASDHHRSVAWIDALPLLLFPIGGYFFGASTWWYLESRYQEARQAVEERAQQRQLLESLSREVRELREGLKQQRSS